MIENKKTSIMKIQNYFLFTLLPLLSSCCNHTPQIKQLESRIDSLLTVISSQDSTMAIMQVELDGYRYDPNLLLTEIKKNYSAKDYEQLDNNYAFLIQYHSASSEAAAAERIKQQAERDKETARKRAEAEAAREEAARKARMKPIEKIMEKYGCSYDEAYRVLHHEVVLGMTAELCRASWGKPRDINRSTGSWGVHEQWCYSSGNYLYFEDGILTSIQN